MVICEASPEEWVTYLKYQNHTSSPHPSCLSICSKASRLCGWLSARHANSEGHWLRKWQSREWGTDGNERANDSAFGCTPYLSQNIFTHCFVVLEHFRVELVQARVHDFHADPHISFAEECAIEVDCVRASTGAHWYVQVHQEAFLFLSINRGGYPFHGHHSPALDVSHFLHNAISPSSQVADFLQPVGVHLERLLAYGDCGAAV